MSEENKYEEEERMCRPIAPSLLEEVEYEAERVHERLRALMEFLHEVRNDLKYSNMFTPCVPMWDGNKERQSVENRLEELKEKIKDSNNCINYVFEVANDIKNLIRHTEKLEKRK
jgi:archaellum component FlaC